MFLGFKNQRNAGACYMNLGCLVTRQAMLEYAKAKEYMDAAIAIQEQIIQANIEHDDAPKETLENDPGADLESNMLKFSGREVDYKGKQDVMKT